eukprot:363015-Chlamydomonas_euryale.AAC.4
MQVMRGREHYSQKSGKWGDAHSTAALVLSVRKPGHCSRPTVYWPATVTFVCSVSPWGQLVFAAAMCNIMLATGAQATEATVQGWVPSRSVSRWRRAPL